LIGLLQGRLGKLSRCWSLNLNDDDNFVRLSIADALNEHIQNLFPRWGQRLISDDREVQRHRRIVVVGFNISTFEEIYTKTLKARWKWLEEECPAKLQVPDRTSRRIFKEAIETIAERMVNAAAAVGASAKPDVELSAPMQPAPQIWNFLAHLVELSDQLQPALNAARDACQAQHRAFYTSDVLLALLDLSGGRVTGCFDTVRPGLASSIREQLVATLDDDRQHEQFVPFAWLERSDVQLAGQYAISDGRPVVSDMHLLLAILDGESATNRWLKRLLGEEHRQVRAVAERHRHDGPTVINSPTPDGLL
jgi:hypothetical protein